ncbi:MAG TPA: SgcJ/EcaC family oxidoreductase [Gemmatimonadales bacterium]|nr:SgcJ/EcaC family oxidoreductase [Gemmatimonadales bacterium]
MIEATVDRYVAASNKGDADALAELYADDALLLPPDHEPIHGREAIVEFWRQGTDEGLEVSTLRLEVNGDVAYLVGRYRLPPTEEEAADSGQYVLCLKRQADGAWKLTADIWNGSGESDERGPDGESPGTTVS